MGEPRLNLRGRKREEKKKDRTHVERGGSGEKNVPASAVHGIAGKGKQDNGVADTWLCVPCRVKCE